MEKPDDVKVVEAVRLIVEDLRVLHPEVDTSDEVVRRVCQCFTLCTIPEDDDAYALAVAVLGHVYLVHADLGAAYVTPLLPLGLRFFAERGDEDIFGMAGLLLVQTCLHYQALGYLSKDVAEAVIAAGERVVVEEDGYDSIADIVILMAGANGADGIVRNLLKLEGLRGEPITYLFNSDGQVIWHQNVLRSILSEYYSDEEVVCISRFLTNARRDGNE